MQMKRRKKLTSFVLCMVLIVAMALGTSGCNGSTNKDAASNTGASDPGTSDAGASNTGASNEGTSDAGTSDAGTEEDAQTDASVLGVGNTVFCLTVVDREGSEKAFEIHTDKETVGAALLELGLIAGEESTYGLYVKTVNGITADYDKDGTYWAFYINGEYASSGVDSTKIAEGESYSLKIE